VIARVEPLSSPDEDFAKGNESDAFMGGEQPQGFAECPGPGPALQKRDDLAERRTRSASCFLLPYGYLTPGMSLPKEASRTADFNMAVQVGDVFKPKSLF
jgi:hypothetical protein